jgi:hypothetical protein
MLDQHAQALREQIIGKHIPSTCFESTLLKTHPANATLLFFLRIGPKDGHSDLIIAVMRNWKDTAAGVVVIKGDKLITLVLPCNQATIGCLTILAWLLDAD